MAITEPDFAFLRHMIHRTAGIIIDPEGSTLMETRLDLLVRREGFRSISDLVRAIQLEPDNRLRTQTVESMANGETLFFRDYGLFQALRDTILPSLIEARRDERRLDLWSAASSTGQEAYSLAMLLDDGFPELRDWDVRILVTDLSAVSLERVRTGRYAQFEVNRGLPAQMLLRYFRQEGEVWTIDSRLRRWLDIRQQNLLEPWPIFPVMDIVLLRNVMIYWQPETKRDVLSKVRSVMSPRSHLLLGAAETVYGLDDGLDRVGFDGCCSYQLVQKDRGANR